MVKEFMVETGRIFLRKGKIMYKKGGGLQFKRGSF